MKISNAVVLCILVGVGTAVLSSCGQATQSLTGKDVTYSSCLQHAVSGGGRLAAEEIRSLCAEAAQVISAQYRWTEQGNVPSNDFTVCYDKEKKLLESSKVPDASRLAKLSCKYPDVK